MPRNIVVCCDGTGNEFGESKSNVVKLYKMLACDDSQITYYHPGVGTMGARNALTGKVVDEGEGTSVRLRLLRQHRRCLSVSHGTFHPDDPLYIFGFSRGAYTARALCGMLRIIGLLREEMRR